jgi:hypothetical protein
VAIAGAIGQVIYSRVKGKELGYMTWASLGLVIVLGSATLLTHDPALRAGEARDRAFRDRRHHAQARLDAALHAADRDRDHSGICHLRRLRLGRAVFVLAAGTIGVAMTGDMKLWTFYVTVVLVGAKIAAFAINTSRFVLLVGSRLRAPPALEYASKGPSGWLVGEIGYTADPLAISQAIPVCRETMWETEMAVDGNWNSTMTRRWASARRR